MQKIVFSSFLGKFLTAMAIVSMVLAALPVIPVHAANITVNTPLDSLTTDGLCSLREAIINANNDGPPPPPYPDCTMGTGADTIILQSGTTYTLSLKDSTPLGGDLDIVDVDGLTIRASGAAPAIINANGIDRVIETTTGSGPLTLVSITVTNGNAASGGRGGGILYASNSALTLVNSTISNNVASNIAACGGGIYNSSAATVTISNSTFEGNNCTVSGGDGGGLFKGIGGTLSISGSTFHNNGVVGDGKGGGMRLTAGTATITNSTFANNTAGNDGGGIQVNGATVSIVFSTFSDNVANDPDDNGGGAIQVENGSINITASILANSTSGMDCNQSLTGTATLTNTLVENNDNCTTVSVITGDPGLSALNNNGGPTQTMAITNTSLAYNAASSCGSTSLDQRGIARPQNGNCDLGAYELGATDAAPVVLNVVRADNNPTEDASSVDFIVTFSESVTGVDQTDFVLTPTGLNTGSSITGVSGSGAVYTVSINTGTGEGTLRLDVNASGTGIQDLGGNPLNGGFTGGETYTIQSEVAPLVLDILLAGPSPTSAASVDFTVTFSEVVTGVDTSAPFADFDLFTTGAISGAAVTSVVDTGDHISYTVTVDTGTGNGTIRLDVVDNDSILDAASNPLGGPGAGNGSFTTGEAYTIRRSCTRVDFDGDGTTDVGVFRPSNGGWFVKDQFVLGYGTAGDVPVPNDYDGDGDSDVAIFRNGAWFVKDQFVLGWGTAGDIPVQGDYNGDCITDIAVFRPSTGGWYVKDQFVLGYGTAGDIPVPGDYDGDGDSDVAVFRDGAWFVKDQFVLGWGTAGDIPVPGDYDGDGDTDIAVFRPSTGGWYVKDQFVLGWGAAGDFPVPGDYDNDGDTDVAVFRNGAWFVKDQFVTGYGTIGDIPLPGRDTNGDGDPYQ